MPVPLLVPGDPDPIDSSRMCDLASAGLPHYCAAIALDVDGEEIYLLCRYDLGEADYVPNWAAVAPHELLGPLPVYWKR